ncbi:MAG: hypothetical protein K2W95_27920 [Candidatus Obscuribacterales bacterium]|nr:hypothetical protein [Candidatus Obscuribacterales bacterium]
MTDSTLQSALEFYLQAKNDGCVQVDQISELVVFSDEKQRLFAVSVSSKQGHSHLTDSLKDRSTGRFSSTVTILEALETARAICSNHLDKRRLNLTYKIESELMVPAPLEAVALAIGFFLVEAIIEAEDERMINVSARRSATGKINISFSWRASAQEKRGIADSNNEKNRETESSAMQLISNLLDPYGGQIGQDRVPGFGTCFWLEMPERILAA